MLLRLQSKHACALASYSFRWCVHPGIEPCSACSLRTACDPSRHHLGRWETLLSNLCSASIPAPTLSLCARVPRDRTNMRHAVRLARIIRRRATCRRIIHIGEPHAWGSYIVEPCTPAACSLRCLTMVCMHEADGSILPDLLTRPSVPSVSGTAV